MRISKVIYIPTIFLLLLIIGSIGYTNVSDKIPHLIFAHLIGLSILGLYGSWAGAVAQNNERSYFIAFLVTLFVPILVGFLAVYYVIPSENSLACGGTVSLTVGIFIPVFFSM